MERTKEAPSRPAGPSGFRAKKLKQLSNLGFRAPRGMNSRPIVVIVGPAPGQAGGISSVMSYLQTETLQDRQFDIRFLDTMRNGSWSVPKFVGVVATASLIMAQARLSARRVVFHLNVSTGGSTYRKWFISCLCRMSATPYVVHLHGSKYRAFFGNSKPIVRRMVKSLFTSAKSVIVLGNTWHDYVIAQLSVDPNRVAIVANGTPKIAQDLDWPNRADYKKIRIIFSGRISKQKGVPELLAAADRVYKDCQEFELVLMGDSRDEQLLEQARARPYCVVTGWLSHDDVVKELASSHVFTLPSHDEGLPMAMIEAMSLGMPVVVTTVGAIPDVIVSGREGYLVEPGNISALTEALGSLVREPSLREEMGRMAHDRWRTELRSDEMVRRIQAEWDVALKSVVRV